MMMKMWAVATEKYHAGKQKDRWAYREREEGKTQRDILRLTVGVGNVRTKFYDYMTLAEIFRSNIDKVSG